MTAPRRSRYAGRFRIPEKRREQVWIVRFQCSHCQGILAIEDVEAGEPVLCGHCGEVALVPPSPFSPGAVIADFVLRDPLGQGAMGRVFRTEQLSLNRPAALRVLPEHLASSEQYVASFETVARTAARFEHPGIIRMYEAGEDEGIVYMAMELAVGATLADVIRHSGRVVVERGLQILAAVARALAAAHAACRLPHGAVTPANIVLHDQGAIRLADYGLLRPVVDVDVAGASWLPLPPEFMAPEQTLGRPATVLTDVYNLGASIYYALTGRPPVEGATPLEIARHHRTRLPADPRTFAPEIPEDVAGLLLRMLAPPPEERIPDMNAVLTELEKTTVFTGSGSGVGGAVPPAPAPSGPPPPPAASESSSGTASASGRKRRTLRVRRPSSRKAVKPASSGGETTGAPPAAPAVPSAPAAEPAAPPAGTPAESAAPPPSSPSASAPATATASGSGTTGSPPAAEAEERRRQRRWRMITFVAGLVLLAAVLGALALLQPFGKGAPQVPTAGEAPEGAPGPGKIPPELAATVRRIEKELQENPDSTAVLAEVARVQQQYPDQKTVLENLLRKATPLIEKEVRSIRRNIHDKELAEWKKRSAALQEEKRKREEEEARRRQAEEEARRRAEEEAKLAELRRKRQAELRKRKHEIRWKAITLCREARFLDAKLLFTPLTAAPDPEIRSWAESKSRCIELAGKLWDMIADSGETLKGVRVPVPGKPRRAVIEYIGARSISAAFRKKEYGPDGRVVGETIEERVRIPLRDLKEPVLWDLAQRIWAKKHPGADESELYLMFGAFLLSRARYLADAERYFERAGRPEVTSAFLQELREVSTEIREQEWQEHWKRVQMLQQAGNTAGVQRYLQQLKVYYPEQYKKHEKEVKALIEGGMEQQ